MFATDVVNELQAKKAIILAAASTGLDRTKKKINVGLVGSPGLAKSLLLRHAAKLVPGSRLESAQSSTGKGLTAAVTSKEGEGMILTTGAIPAAKGAIAALNEVGRISPDDQKYLLDVMEEQEFTINKADIHAKVLAPVAIIASCNPVQGEYGKDVNGEDIIDLNDFPAIMPLKDRFDLIIPIKSVNKNDEQKNREYALTKLSRHAKTNKKIPPNYEQYIKRHIEISKRFDPDLSDEAIEMLTNYYIEITKQSEHGSRRPLETITALAKLIAKLNLKSTVDGQDVKEVMQFYSEVSKAAGKILNLVTSPVESACKAFVEILQTTGQPMTAAQLYNSACDQNPHIKDYLGDEPKIEKNWRLRGVIDKILQNNHIRVVQDKPKTLRWIETQPDTNTKSDQDNGNNGNSCSSRQASDVSDAAFSYGEIKNKKNIDFLQQDRQTLPSDTSDSTRIETEQSSASRVGFTCFYCDTVLSSDEERGKHRKLEHPDQPLDWPTQDDFIHRLER
jgi:MoxR-like ATPase